MPIIHNFSHFKLQRLTTSLLITITEQANMFFLLLFYAFKDGGIFLKQKCTERCTCSNFDLVCENFTCQPSSISVRMGKTTHCECKDGFFADGENCKPLRDCFDVYREKNVTTNGTYSILPLGWSGAPFKAYCNMDNEGGWIVS